MKELILKIIDLGTIMLSFPFFIVGIAGSVSLMFTARRYPPRDEGEADGYRKSYIRFNFLLLVAVMISLVRMVVLGSV